MYIKGTAMWKCRTTMSTAPRGIGYMSSDHPFMANVKIPTNSEKVVWVVSFEKDKWYNVEYETWDNSNTARINGGYKRAWVVNESGEKVEVAGSQIRILFYTDYNKDEMRNSQLDNLFNGHRKNT